MDSEAIADFLNNNRGLDPASRMAGVAALLGLQGQALSDALEAMTLIEVRSIDIGVSFLAAPSFDAMRAPVKAILDAVPKERLDFSEAMRMLARGGMERVMADEGWAAFDTSFGGMFISAAPILALDAICRWRLPKS